MSWLRAATPRSLRSTQRVQQMSCQPLRIHSSPNQLKNIYVARCCVGSRSGHQHLRPSFLLPPTPASQRPNLSLHAVSGPENIIPPTHDSVSKNATEAPPKQCRRFDLAPRSVPSVPAPPAHHIHNTRRLAVSGHDPDNNIPSDRAPDPKRSAGRHSPSEQSASSVAWQMTSRQQAQGRN